MTNPRDELMAPEIDLHTYCGADARRWAEAFSQIKARQGWSVDDIDTDLMIGWFANAIEVACAIRLAASRPAPVDREAVARAICQTGKFETGEGTCALLCMDQLGSPRKKGCCHSARVHGKLADSILSLLRPAEPVEAERHCEELYRHRKRGTTYRILHGDEYGTCFASSSSVAQIDHEPMIVYQDIADGRVWVRPRSEFFDGRFEKLPRAAKPTTPDAVGEPVEAWNPVTSPGMTDLMVPPESLDAFMEANPLPTPDAVGEPVAWRVLITKNAKTYNEYTERLPFEPLEGSGVVVRREPEPLYTHPPAQLDTSAAVLAERERCAAIADEWANKMARNHGRETANTIAAAIRQLPTESKP